MSTLAFYQPHMDLQGTGVSYFDYCHFNQSILGNKSVMIYDEVNSYNSPLVIEKFKQHNIELVALPGTQNMPALEDAITQHNAAACYLQKNGKINEGRWVNNVPMFVHVVGMNNEPHGKVYAYVSEWSSIHCSKGEHPFVPYCVHLPDTQEDFREQIGIPRDAIVFGRMGGHYGWDIHFVNEAIVKILSERDDVYFLFAQTPQFFNHPRIIHTHPFADLTVKRKFINTCDAMIHARHVGESFGAACAEFSLCNKPVITYANSPERNHIFTLKDKGIYYSNKEEVYQILSSFNKEWTYRDWNAYKAFTPNEVMKKFKSVFLDSL